MPMCLTKNKGIKKDSFIWTCMPVCVVDHIGNSVALNASVKMYPDSMTSPNL